MDHQVRHLAVGGPPRRGSLAARGLQAQVDLSKEHRSIGIEEIFRIGEGKGKHVGRAIDLPIVAIQAADELVVAHDDGHAGAGPPEEAERTPDEGSKSCRS